MHVRFARAVGMPVADDESLQVVGTIAGMVIQPDTGKIEGFRVTVRGFLSSMELFLSSMDILHWGTRVTISRADVLAPLEDHIRLQSLLDEQRPLLGQSIRTETNVHLGKCADVQFDTTTFVIEWLFPRKFFRWGTPIPVSQIIEVKKSEIIVKDLSTAAAEKVESPAVTLLNMPEAV